MNKYLSILADHYALWQIHKNKSKEYQFVNDLLTSIPISDSNLFYKSPGIPDITFCNKTKIDNYNFGSFSFESEIQTSEDANNKATGVFFEYSAPSAKANIILIHGWRMANIERMEKMFNKRFMSNNYNLYYYTLPHHFDRTSKNSLFNGEFMISANVNRTAQSIQQAVSDVRALITYLKNRDGKNIVVIGFSLGGLVSNLTGVFEKNVDILVSLFYLNSLANTVWNAIPGKYIKVDFMANDFSYEQLKAYWVITEAINYKPIIPKENILLCSAKFDKYVDLKDANALWEAWDKPLRFVYNCGHSGLVLMKDRLGDDAVTFIENRMKQFRN